MKYKNAADTQIRKETQTKENNTQIRKILVKEPLKYETKKCGNI